MILEAVRRGGIDDKNLSCYEPLDPPMKDGSDWERSATGLKALSADNQPAVRALQPCECPFSLNAWDALFDRSPA